MACLASIVVERVKTSNLMEELFLNTATLSHDARNALLPISLAVRAMQKKHGESIPQEAGEYLDVITVASKTTGDILRSWRSCTGEVPSRYGDCDLLEELRSGIAMFGVQAEGRDIKLEFREPQAGSGGPQEEIRIRVASVELDRVIQGYFSNAIKYCSEMVRVEVINEEGAGEAGFRVDDDGAGIDMEFRDQVFDSFFQLPDSQPGEGLGLAGVRFIVERNGGRFGVDQSPEGGSSFWAVFPKV
jgi:signal transduction histidine kinase